MSWAELAACVDYPTSVFFPDHGNGAAAAKQICARCPVVGECREAGMNVPHGVWGGLTETERFGTTRSPSMRVCRECGGHFTADYRRPTCDDCRTRIRRETWLLSAHRTRKAAS